MDLLTLIIVSTLIGLFIGIMSGLLGIGGGTVMVPIFRLIYNMPAVAATATSLFTILPTSISGLIMHLKHKTCLPKLGVIIGVGGALVSPIGVQLAQLSPGWLVMVVAAVIIAYSAYNMFSKALKMKPEKSAKTDKTARAGKAANAASAAQAGGEDAAAASAEDAAPAEDVAPAAVQPPQITFDKKHLLTSLLIGAVAGLASGYIGVGGGFIMIPLMIALLNIPMKLASGTSLISIFILAIPGVIEQGMLGNINYYAGLAMSIGSIPGALIGAKLINYVPERTLCLVFGTFLLIAAVMLIVKETGVLG